MYFSWFKYIWLIVGSPVFGYLSEKTESIIEGKDYPFSFKQLMKDIVRGVRLALRNALWQTVYTFTLLILSFVPILGWVTPLVPPIRRMLLLRVFHDRLQLRTPKAFTHTEHRIY